MKIIFGFAAQILSPFVFLLCLPAVIKALCMTQWNVGKSEVPSDRVAKDSLCLCVIRARLLPAF